MRTNRIIVAAALGALLVIDYWPIPPWWGLITWLSAAIVALLWSVGALLKARQSEDEGCRRTAMGLVVVTVCLAAFVVLVRPITRFRIALSAEALASEVAAGSMVHRPPIRVGLFDVGAVWIDGERASFTIGQDENGWQTDLIAQVRRSETGPLRLTDWEWHRRIE